MIFKLKSYRSELLGTLIHQMETMQNRTNISRERIRQIDKEIADLGARNIVIARLHTSGVLNAAEHSMQTAEINNKITELRTERRKRLSEDENDELIDTQKDLNEILEEYELTTEFDSELFGQDVYKRQHWRSSVNMSKIFMPRTAYTLQTVMNWAERFASAKARWIFRRCLKS